MSIIARQSTAITVTVGPVLDADGAIVTDAAVGDFLIAKNGTQGALNGSATLVHQHAGKYALTLTTADTGTVGTLEVSMNDAPNECPVKELQVIEEAVYDALYAASATGYSTLTAAQVNTEADTALSDVGLTSTVTGRIDAAISTRLASASYTTPLDEAGVRTAIGLASANLDTQIADLPTVAEFEARTIVAANYFDPATDVVIVGTNNDKTGYSLATAPPTAAAIADAVLDETMSGHTTAGTLGKAVADILEDTAVIGAAGAGLTEAGGTGDQFTGIASVGAVTGTVGGIAGTTQTLDALATLIRGTDGDTLKTLSDQIDSIPTTIRVKKNAALAGLPIVMLDTSGDPATSKTVTGTVSIDGAAFTSLTNSISEVSGGLYTVDLDAADTNGNTLVMRFTATGCRTRFVEIVTQP